MAGECIFEAQMPAIVGEVHAYLDPMMRNEFAAEICHYGFGGNVQQPYNATHNGVQQATNRGFSVHI